MKLHWSVPVYVAGSIIGSALYFSVPANASPQADSTAAEYAYAHGGAICDAIRRHPTPIGVAIVVDTLNSSSLLTAKQVGQVLYLAINDDCPQFMPIADKWSDDMNGANA